MRHSAGSWRAAARNASATRSGVKGPSFERLPRTVTESDGSVHSNLDWERTHKNFHMTLLSASPSKTLLAFCDQLHDRLNRYRSFAAVGAAAPRDWKSEHEAIAEATIDRDADLAVSRLMDHYMRTTAILQNTLAAMRTKG